VRVSSSTHFLAGLYKASADHAPVLLPAAKWLQRFRGRKRAISKAFTRDDRATIDALVASDELSNVPSIQLEMSAISRWRKS
jgi:hypothetical protein